MAGALIGQPMAGRRVPGRHFIHTGAAPSFLWFAAIQGIERIEDLVSLAPKGCFIAAEAIKRKAQKSTSNF